MTMEKDAGFAAPRVAWPDDPAGRLAVANQAGQLIRHGGLVVYPTDTVYGIGTDPMNPLSVQRLFEAKARPAEKAIVWLIDRLDRAADICELTESTQRLAAAFWPGALTLVLPRLRPESTDLPTQALRVPNHPAALAIIAAAGGAAATTSANRSGSPSARNAEEATDALGQHVDLIVDAGQSSGGVDSTILDLTTEPFTILRGGPITAADIERVLGSTVEHAT